MSQYKVNCRPAIETCDFSETRAMIPLVPLAIHTIDRILEIPDVKDEISKKQAEQEPNEVLEVDFKLKIGDDT